MGPRLNFDSIQALLEQASLECKPNGERESTLFEKFLVVNQIFLEVTQQRQIYQFYVYILPYRFSARLYIAHRLYADTYSNFNLIRRLFVFLKPSFLRIYFCHAKVNLMKKFSELVSLATGKVALTFEGGSEKDEQKKIIKRHWHKIDELECEAWMLSHVESTSVKSFDKLVVKQILTTSQLEFVFRQKAKFIELVISGNFGMVSKISKNCVVRRCQVSVKHPDKASPIVLGLVKSCPKLTLLELAVNVMLEHWLPTEQFVDQIVNQHGLFTEIVKDVQKLAPYLKFEMATYINRNHNSQNLYLIDWLPSLKKRSGFKDIEVHSNYGYCKLIPKNIDNFTESSHTIFVIM